MRVKPAQKARWVAGLKYCACGTLIANPRHWHCSACRERRKRHRQREKEVRRRRGTPTERGYGTMHKQLRSKWAAIVATGTVRCARCGRPIRSGEYWDLGHDDFDRTKYTGPEHRKCNRATAGRRSAA
jgi:hypothetical protein